MSQTLNGQRVLVLGATGGIGGAAAVAFKALGAQVETPGRGELDVTDEASVNAYFDTQAPFDHVVVSASATKTGPVSALSVADAQESMNNKFFGAYRVARAAKITAHGSLTLVSGMLGRRPNVSSVLQGAINAALEGLARGLALEKAPVRVNVVSPGLIDTKLHAKLSETQRGELFAKAAKNLPVGRVGQPEDVAQAIVFVATNGFTTGATIGVDGGALIA